ncbi:MAG: hypothetical protein V2B18_23570 [Pseudomonadota bacterium]
MHRSNSRLDAISEMLALSSSGNGKNIIFSGLNFEGPMDLPAFHEAVRLALADFPHFTSTIREVKVKGRHHLFRLPSPDPELPYSVKDLKITDDSDPLLHSILDTLRPRLDRDWDLFRELPLELCLIRVSERHHVLATFIHHVAGDASNLLEYGQALTAKYHELVKGRIPDWKHQPLPVSTSAKRPVERRPVKWQALLRNAVGTVSGFLKSPAMPLGSGIKDDCGQYHVKRVLSTKDSQGLTRSPGEPRGALPDRVTAATHLAVDQWNRERGLAPGTLTTSMTVNMRGRYRDLDNPNNSALIFLRSLPHERKDPDEFRRLMTIQRIKRFRSQTDFGYYQDLERFNNALRLLPFHLRRRLVSLVLGKHQVSVAITFLGILWPSLRNGKPTGDTFLETCGDLDLTEVHGIGYKLASNTRLLLVVYAFRNRLNLVLSASADLFTRLETEQFLDLITANFLGSSF